MRPRGRCRHVSEMDGWAVCVRSSKCRMLCRPTGKMLFRGESHWMRGPTCRGILERDKTRPVRMDHEVRTLEVPAVALMNVYPAGRPVARGTDITEMLHPNQTSQSRLEEHTHAYPRSHPSVSGLAGDRFYDMMSYHITPDALLSRRDMSFQPVHPSTQSVYHIETTPRAFLLFRPTAFTYILFSD